MAMRPSFVISKAQKIAGQDLRACYREAGIMAGATHFDDFWARDAFFASWGALALGDFDKVRQNLDLFLSYQRPDGLIPRRLNRYYGGAYFKYITNLRLKARRPRPVFWGNGGFPDTDPNALLVITASFYAKAANDRAWVSRHRFKLQKALEWLTSQDFDRDGLINEGPYSNWLDTIKKFSGVGTVLYSNVLALVALKAGDDLGIDHEHWVKSPAQILTRLRQRLWTGQFFAAWASGPARTEVFDVPGNLLGVVLGIFSAGEAKSILDHLKRCLVGELLPATNYPAYSQTMVHFYHKLDRLTGYHNNYARWLWVSALYAVALKQDGQTTRAKAVIERGARWIAKHGTVYEVYRPNGEPYNGLTWKSERSFAWSAGLFLWTIGE